jgi:predicted chitinase
VQCNPQVRAAVSRWICHTESEWDPDNNAKRYQDLKKTGGYFEPSKDPDSKKYDDFSKFLMKIQFMDKVPGLAGRKKFHYFHPLAFIRHFRKCGWLSAKELAQCIPRKTVDQTKNHTQQTVYPTSEIRWNVALKRAGNFIPHLNVALRKYGISTNGLRTAYFMGNAIQETIYLTHTAELDGVHSTYAPWYGRGVIQLTFEENYKHYGDFRGWSGTPSSYRNSIENDLSRACDSGGFYWISCARTASASHNINKEADETPHFSLITLQNVCADYSYTAHSCSVPHTSMEFRACAEFEKSARAVNTGDPNTTGVLKGLIPRMNVFMASVVTLTDILIDYRPAYTQKDW